MKEYSLAIREGLRNFLRARTFSLAMTGCVAVAVFTMGAFALLALNVNSLLKRWESRVELVAFLRHDLDAEKAQKVLGRILTIPKVGEARLISSQEAWKEFFTEVDPGLGLDGVSLDEVLPPSIVIRLASGNRDLEVIKEVASYVEAVDGVDEVKFEEILLERYLQFRREVATFTAGTSIFWVLIFGIITVNISRLALTARKNEINTLRMLGASTHFIRRVFSVEGIVQGIAGSAIGVAALAATAFLLSKIMGPTLESPLMLFAAIAAVGPALALLASQFSLRNVLILLVALLLIASPAGLAHAEDDLESELARHQQELERLTSQLRQSRSAAAEIAQRERAVIDELERLDKEIDGLKREIKLGERNIATNKAATAKAHLELARCEKDYAQSRKELEQWLRLLCTRKEPTIVEVILYDIPQSEITRRRQMVSRLAQKEAEAFEKTEKFRNAFLEQQENLRKRVELDSLYNEAVKLRVEQMADRRGRREDLLESLRERKSIYLAAINDLEASARDLQKLVDAQQADAQSVFPGSVPFREMKGLLPWPAEGGIAVPFGRIQNPDSRTYTRHLGIDISAKAGSEIRSIHDALVAYSDWFRGYGKLVILDHGGGYSSIYSHCSEIFVKKGDNVRAGQPIALVGETGSLKGPVLYFEIRENGQPVDPIVWLQRRTRCNAIGVSLLYFWFRSSCWDF